MTFVSQSRDYDFWYLNEVLVLKNDKGLFELEPSYQRGVVWDTRKMSNFILSCFEGIIPNIILFNNDTKNNKWICIDGKQRLTSIIQFYKNQIPVNLGNGYKYYNDLLDKQKTKFNDTKITAVYYNDLSYTDQVYIFSKIQHGETLEPGELMVTYFTDEKILNTFTTFANKLGAFLNKFGKIRIHRKDHYIYIIEMLYMIDKNSYILPDKNTRHNYIKNLSLDTLTKLTELITLKFLQLYGVKVINSKRVPKSTKKYILLILTLIYINNNINKSEDRLIDILNFVNTKYLKHNLNNTTSKLVYKEFKTLLL